MQSDANPDNPYRGPHGFDRRAIPLGLGLGLAVVFALVMSAADASVLARAAIGVPLLGAFVAWAVVYAIPAPSGGAGTAVTLGRQEDRSASDHGDAERVA